MKPTTTFAFNQPSNLRRSSGDILCCSLEVRLPMAFPPFVTGDATSVIFSFVHVLDSKVVFVCAIIFRYEFFGLAPPRLNDCVH